MHRRQVLQALQPVGLEPPLPIVEAGPVHAGAPAGGRDAAQRLRQLQHVQPLPRQLLGRVLGHHPNLRLMRHHQPLLKADWRLNNC